MNKIIQDHTIVAVATAEGESAIALVRLSGRESIKITNQLFEGKDLEKVKSQTIHFGKIVFDEEVIDEVLVSVFKQPHTYTGENIVEISCHGSKYIVQKIIELCIGQGAKAALPGEFTMRAFLNGKMDLSQAEAVADLIHSQSEASHRTAMNQLKGGFSNDINEFREKLINFAAMIELELDFSEEDIEFVDRSSLNQLIIEIQHRISELVSSFTLGNVIKNGVPVVIVGKPNAGKSTLFNQLLKEDRAIVSDLEGTTRDVIEEVLVIDGIQYRFVDTAGIREAKDKIEKIGIDKTYQKIEQSALMIYVFDASLYQEHEVNEHIQLLTNPNTKIVIVANHCDKNSKDKNLLLPANYIQISALHGQGIQALKDTISSLFLNDKIKNQQTIVTNIRHVDALKRVNLYLEEVKKGMEENKTGDLLSVDIRMALSALSEITGAIEIDKDILGTIFGKFCIGK